MPVIKSAGKKLRQSQSHHERNLVAKRRVKAVMDNYKRKPNNKDLPKVYAAIDKLAKIGVIHRNKAARLKSRLSHLVKTEVRTKPAVAKKAPKTSKKK